MSDTKETLVSIFGIDSVFDDNETLDLYMRDESFTRPLSPRYVVKAHNKEEMEKLISWANETLTPLIPVSSGPPRFRGDTVPGTPGAVIVDLSSMNKILRIDRRNRIAIIEPGVSYGQLQPELKKEGLRLTTTLMPRPNKSVLASLLEREPRTVPRFQWSVLDPLRCVEVVWGDGNSLVSGNGDASEMAPYYPHGPAQTDYHRLISGAQGTMGIVTWASVKCEVVPQLHNLYFVRSGKLEDLTEFCYKVLKIRFGDELLLLNSTYLATILEDSNEKVEALSGEFPPWIALVGIAGRDRFPEERVNYQAKDISEIAQNLGLYFEKEIPGVRNKKVADAIINPARSSTWKLEQKGGREDIFFVATLDQAPSYIAAMYKVAAAHGFNTDEIGIYLQPIHQGTACHVEFSLPYDPENEAECSRVRELSAHACETLLNRGAFFARPYGSWASPVFNRDRQSANTLSKIKNIFDPNHIMNPGKLIF